MKCTVCGSKAKVIDTLPCEDVTYRRIKCLGCERVFCTVEYEVEDSKQLRKDLSKAYKIKNSRKENKK